MSPKKSCTVCIIPACPYQASIYDQSVCKLHLATEELFTLLKIVQKDGTGSHYEAIAKLIARIEDR